MTRALPATALLGALLAAWAWAACPVRASELSCTDCHEVTAEKFAASVHGLFSCAGCHSGAEQFPHAEGSRQVDCAPCHSEAVETYRQSIHGLGRAEGISEAASCADCHGDVHTITPHTEATSSVHWSHLAEACARCHGNVELAERFHFTIVRPIAAYLASAHARAVAAGRRGAVCSDCHGDHAIFPAADPRSTVFHARVPELCSTCHAEIGTTYSKSVHGLAAARGVRDAPVCTDCHGEHRILSPSEPGSPVFATNIPSRTCGHCHTDVRLSEKYGLPLDKVPAYKDSYHGLAGRAGVQTVANCASCHGVHDILPSSDPRSHVHPANLPRTCGLCHPGAGSRFAIGPVHVVSTEARFTAVYYVRLIYLPLIFLTIGGMVLHNLLDFIRKARMPVVRSLAAIPAKEERMSLGFRLTHGLVMVSFPLLVYTGFALKYPESWWARPAIQWEADLGLRSWLHRAAAIVLLGSLGAHFIHLARSRRARACIAGMRPSRVDWQEFKLRLRYYLGLSGETPRTGKVGYVEKTEYWAFLWGMAVMSVTGLLLWFEGFTLRWLPGWASDAATAVHFYEAILASLAILVWHFYWVIFDPAVYPMDWSWWSGRAPVSRTREWLATPVPAPPPGNPATEPKGAP